MTRASSSNRELSRRRAGFYPVLLGVMLLGMVPLSRGAGSTLVTNVAALQQAGTSSRVVTLDLTGEIWWAETRSGRFLFRDASGIQQLQLHLPVTGLAAGRGLRLFGDCLVSPGRDGLNLASVPAVDNDGLHSVVEKSGTVRLQAGFHPLRVEWFNRTDKSELELEFSGPDLPRQRISASALFRWCG